MTVQELPKNKKIILFDGVCNLCDLFVRFVIKHDTNDVFRFVSLDSEPGKEIIAYLGIDRKLVDSVILYEPGIAYYYKSNAVLEIAKSLNGIVSLGTVFKIIPLPLRNFVYDYIAKNRYKWYGKKDHCLLPTPELKGKFLE